MLFRNLRHYEYTGRGRPRTSRLEEQFDAHRFVPCRPQQAESLGWVPPDGSDDGPLVIELGERQLFCLCVEQRPVPAAVVRDEVARRARALAAKAGRRAGRRELADLRDEVLLELRPRAFSRVRRHPVVIDAEAGLLLTDATSTAAADRLAGALREAWGNLPIKVPETGRSVPATLTRWLRAGKTPSPLVLGSTCVLRDARDRQRSIRLRGAAELAADTGGHIEAGFEAVELELDWADRLRFRITEDLLLRGIAELGDEDGDGQADSDPAAEFAASALVETAALVQALVRLRTAFGLG